MLAQYSQLKVPGTAQSVNQWRKLKTGARLGWDDNDLINSLFKTLDQIRNLNNNELPLCLQDVQRLINGKRTYNWQVDN